jgi:hypothetical protein
VSVIVAILGNNVLVNSTHDHGQHIDHRRPGEEIVCKNETDCPDGFICSIIKHHCYDLKGRRRDRARQPILDSDPGEKIECNVTSECPLDFLCIGTGAIGHCKG